MTVIELGSKITLLQHCCFEKKLKKVKSCSVLLNSTDLQVKSLGQLDLLHMIRC
jgi:hypothetical protein